jgi:hypothetical protein
MTMTETTPDLKLVIKIEKLLAQAADPGCTPAEREAFDNAALSMMAKHRIDRSMVGGNLAADDVLGKHRYGDIVVGPYVGVLSGIVSAVASGYDSRILYDNRTPSPWSDEITKACRRIQIYGWKSDADLVRTIAERLVADAMMQASAVKGFDRGDTVAERRSFLLGYSLEIDRRMREATDAARAAAIEEGIDVASTDLVLVDRKAQMNEAFDKLRLRAGTAPSAVTGGNSGFTAGRAAGSSADLSTGSNSVGTTKAIGR